MIFSTDLLNGQTGRVIKDKPNREHDDRVDGPFFIDEIDGEDKDNGSNLLKVNKSK